MILYVIRHGETSWNKKRRLQGQHGSDLDQEGILLAEKTRDGMRDIPLDLCYTSPLIRAKHTAEIICEGRNIPILEEKRIMEIAFGVWEGKCCDLNRLEIPRHRYLDFHEHPWRYVPPEGGERVQDVVDRCHDFYEELIHREDLQDKNILISTHGCASRAFLHSVYEDKEDFWHGGVPMNCAVSKVVVENGLGRLVESDKVYYGKEYYHNFYQAQREAELHENK